jgi:peroxiredoxin
MDGFLLLARLVLAATFLIAAPIKLADRDGSRRMLVDFGVPSRPASILALGLPLIELAIALALLLVASAWFGAVGALCLLAAFIVVIAANLARGRKPLCNCFGQIHSAPIGWTTLARNAVLASLAALVAWEGGDDPGPSMFAWLDDLSIIESVALVLSSSGLVLLGAVVVLLLQVLRQQGRLLMRFDTMEERVSGPRTAPVEASVPVQSVVGLPVGARAPDFRLSGLQGQAVTLDELTALGKVVLLFFTNPNCGPCQALLPEVADWRRRFASTLTICLIAEGNAADNQAKAHDVDKGILILLQRGREVAEAYQAYGTPAAVLIRPDGVVGSAVAQGADAIRNLVLRPLNPSASSRPTSEDQARAARASPREPVRLGDLAPALEFQGLDGRTVALADFRGRRVLLLFWNPACGFCQQMLNMLKQWETDLVPDAPTPLLISTGTADENRAMGLRSLVVLDPGFQAGAAFGAGGTPMGILIDTTGRIASNLAAGAQAVLALANAPARSPEKPAVA